jgi:hypothetical protein
MKVGLCASYARCPGGIAAMHLKPRKPAWRNQRIRALKGPLVL